MMRFICCFGVLVTMTCVTSQDDFIPVPSLPPGIANFSHQLANSESFFDLWKSALKEVSGFAPTVRFNIEAMTIFAPSESVFAHLIPQDIAHPLYQQGEQSKKLRRDFLFNHLALDVAEPQLATKEGIEVLTLNNNKAYLKKDAQGNFSVEAGSVTAKVLEIMELDNGAVIYRIDSTLFDTRDKLTEAFSPNLKNALKQPLGPPLDLSPVPNHKFSAIDSAAIRLPDGTVVFPPSPPTPDELRAFKPVGPPGPPHTRDNFPQPPAFPLGDDIPQPPASPPFEKSVKIAQVRQEQRSGRRA